MCPKVADTLDTAEDMTDSLLTRFVFVESSWIDQMTADTHIISLDYNPTGAAPIWSIQICIFLKENTIAQPVSSVLGDLDRSR